MTSINRRVFLAGSLVLLGLLAGPAPATADDKIVLKLATVAPVKTPWANLLKEFKTNVETKSRGRIQVNVFLGGALGDENESVRMLARGQIQGVGVSTGSLATLVRELQAIESPFLFRNAQEADYVLDKFLTDHVDAAFRAKGMVFGFWSENGFRHFGARWGAVKTPADLRGRKVRSQEADVHIQMWKALGAAASAIPTTEVSTALKTSAVDGFDQALLFAIAAGWHTQISHLTLSAHIYQPAAIAFNKAWFDKLPADLQAVLIDEGRALTRKGRTAIRNMNPKLVKVIESAKVTLHTLTPAERAAFETATAGVRASMKSTYPAIFAKIEQGLAEYRAKAGGKRAAN